MAADDPFQAHLLRAASLFEAGDVVQAGQIWQAILKRDPTHQAARAGLYQVKLFLDQRAGEVDSEKLLREGCTLYDMGQVQEALEKWERILAADPGHRLARTYVNDARRELGQAAPQAPGAGSQGQAAAPAAPAPPLAPVPAPEGSPLDAPGPRADQLVLEGVQLYDMGMAEEAIAKWHRALELVPEHREAPAYLEMARNELGSAPVRAPAAPMAASGPAPEPLDSRIVRAEQLLRGQRLEEAVQAFQRLLAMAPHDPRILQGYHQARALLNARIEPPLTAWSGQPVPSPAIAIAIEPGRSQPVAAPAPVGPPAAVTRSAPQRSGFRLPDLIQSRRSRLPQRLQQLSLPGWLRRPRNLAITLGLLLALVLALSLYGVHRQEVALREAVAAAKQSALRPVSRMVEIPSLVESAEALQHEAEAAVEDSPLLAYYRAKAWVGLDPDNPGAARLLAQAKAGLAGRAGPGTAAEVDKTIQAGDLEGARKTVLGLLAQAPDDPELQDRARRVALALAPLYAGKDRMAEAREVLLLGRAMFPQDKTWQVRLKLLEALQGMAAADRTPWIHLLG